MIRFKNAPGFEFTSNPQAKDQPAIVYYEGKRIGAVRPDYSNGRGLRFRVYNSKGQCWSDCGQFGNTFSVLKSIAATEGGLQ